MVNILILKDDRSANNKQSYALGQAIKNELEGGQESVKVKTYEIAMHLNALSKLPNFIPIHSMTTAKPKIGNKKFDIIISCGRKLARLLPHIKRKYGTENAKTISILHPNMRFSNFDVVVIPKHDKITPTDSSNIVLMDGAMNVFTPAKRIAKNKYITSLHKPYIAVMVGGSSKHYIMTEQIAKDFSTTINQVAKNMDASLLITTSRRTPKHCIEILKQTLDCSYYLYDYNNADKSENPYELFLNIADYFITSCDSISMISEVCSTEKPVYVYTEGLNAEKYRIFLSNAALNGSIRQLTSDLSILEPFSALPITNAGRVAKDVIQKLKLKFD